MPVILVFEVSSITITKYLHCQFILSLMHCMGDIKDRIQLAVLGVTNFNSIHPEIKTGFYSFKLYKYIFTFKIIRHFKGSTVASGKIFFWYKGCIKFHLTLCNLNFKMRF